MKRQKKLVRNHASVWRKYNCQFQHQWSAYTVDCNHFNRMLARSNMRANSQKSWTVAKIPKNSIHSSMALWEERKVKPMTVDYVRKIIMSMPSKSCESDAVPTCLLKRILDKVAGVITSIINISIRQGVFAPSWKSAIVCP